VATNLNGQIFLGQVGQKVVHNVTPEREVRQQHRREVDDKSNYGKVEATRLMCTGVSSATGKKFWWQLNAKMKTGSRAKSPVADSGRTMVAPVSGFANIMATTTT
jgi:hypothetical protein